MIALRVLIACSHTTESTSLAHMIESKINNKIIGLDISVDVVSTIEEVRDKAHTSNVIILHLNLDDAGPEEVIAAIPELPEPVIVFTKIIDPEIHARCKTAGALVLLDGPTRPTELCSSILHCLGRSVMNALNHLPDE